MISLTSTAQHTHAVLLAQHRTTLRILMRERSPVAFLFCKPAYALHFRLEGETFSGLHRNWMTALFIPQFEFDQKLRLALRQVVMP